MQDIEKYEAYLLIQSAFCDATIASAAWRRYLQTAMASETSGIAHKLYPIIYKNLSQEKFFSDEIRDKLRASYRQAFVINAVRLHHLRPLIEKLNLEKVHYAVVKGSAVMLQSNSLSLRTFGDTDILVGRESSTRAQEILRSQGYFPWAADDFRQTPPSQKKGWTSESWIDADGFIVDLHEAQSSSGFFSMCLSTRVMVSKPYEIFLSNPFYSTLISLTHAAETSGKYDRINTLIDLNILRSSVEESELFQALKKYSFPTSVLELVRTPTSPDNWLEARIKQKRISLELTRSRNRFAFIQTYVKIWWLRRPKSQDFRRVLSSSEVKKPRYILWLLLGRSGLVERCIARHGGFLHSQSEESISTWGDAFVKIWRINSQSAKSVLLKMLTDFSEKPFVVTRDGLGAATLPIEGRREVRIEISRSGQEITLRTSKLTRNEMLSLDAHFELDFVGA